MTDTPDPNAGDRLEELLSEHREQQSSEDADTPGAETAEPYAPFAPAPEPGAPGEDPSDEGVADDGEEESDDLPDAPLFALLRTLEQEISPHRIDRVWIFPPRRIEVGETAVVVVAAFPEADPHRRRVYAAHYTALDDSEQHRLALAEYGTAPPDRVGRLVEEVVERIKDGSAGAPRAIRIDGDEQRWNATLFELAEEHLEEQRKRHRLI